MIRGTNTLAALAAFTASLACAGLAAQAGPPTFRAERPTMLRFRVAGIDRMPELTAKLHVFPLLDDYGYPTLLKAQFERSAARLQKERLVRDEVRRLGIELQAVQLGNMIRGVGDGLFESFGVDGLRQVEMQAFQWRRDGGQEAFTQVMVASCVPGVQGRWARAFRDEVEWWRGCGWFDECEGVKVDGQPTSAFAIPAAKLEGDRWSSPGARWFLELPGAFVLGYGEVADLQAIGGFDLATPPLPPGVHYEGDLAALADMEQSAEAIALTRGVAGLKLDVQFDGELVREQLEATLAGGPTAGVPAVLLGNPGPLAPQALPDGAMLQLRVRLSLSALKELLATVAPMRPPEQEVLDELLQVLDGSLSFGLCAPAPGGMIPRVYATLGLSDASGFTGLVDRMREQGMAMKEVRYDDVPCTVLELPGVPQGVQPTFCVVDGRVHLAESALSMRAFLRAQRDGVETMVVEEAAVPENVPGERLDTIELRFDPARTYQAFYELWQPLLRLSMAGAGSETLSRDDMPEPRDFADYVRPIEVAFFRDGDRIGMHSVGALGGPLVSAYAVVMSQFLTTSSGSYSRFVGTLATHKLTAAGEALRAFEEREQRPPKDLAELFVAQQLDERALWIPGDPSLEKITLPGGRVVETSFRYFREPVQVAVFSQRHAARMISITPGWGRAMLADDGSVREVYGESRDVAIETFGELGR